MSGNGAASHPAARPAGVVATWRQTPRPARALLAGIFVNRLTGFLQIFLVLFLTHRGFSSGQAGVALGVFGVGIIVGTFTGGWLGDRVSARTATLISMLGYAPLLLSILYLHIYPLILVAVLTVSTVGQIYRPAAQAMLTEMTPPERLVMVTAMYRMCLNLGIAVTPLIGTALISVSYTWLFWVETMAAVTYGLIALKFLPGGARPHASGPGKQDREGGRRWSSGYLAVLADGRYLAYLFAVLVMAAVYCQYTVTLPLAIVRSGLGLWWYSAIVSLNAIIVATCEVFATRFVQTWPLRVIVVGGLGLLAVGYGIYAIGMVPVVLIAGTLVWTASEIIGGPTVWSYPGMVAPPRLRARYYGAMQSSFGVGSAVGPVMGVVLWDGVGQALWLWLAVIAAVGMGAGLIGMRRPATEPVGGHAEASNC
jgi:MFS family permease